MKRHAGLAVAAFVAGLAACRHQTSTDVTPWLRRVAWENETIIAESGRGRGVHYERRDARGERLRVEASLCLSMDGGRSALCTDPRGSFLLFASGDRRDVDCRREDETAAESSLSVEKVSELEIACVERVYAPRYVIVRTRMNLAGRVIDRREAPIPRD